MLSIQNINFLQLVDLFFQFLLFIVFVYNFVFFIWILSTWLPVNRSIFILRFVDNLIDPVYHALLRTFPPLRLGIMDFSPFYMFIFLTIVETVIKFIYQFAILTIMKF